LAAGRKPKVVFTRSAGQVAGQTGQVVALTDPAGGDDFVVVRFGRDELPFSPADVTIPPRGSTTRRPAAKAAPAPELRLTEPPPREEPSMPRSTSDSASKAVPAKPPADAAPKPPAEPADTAPAKPRKAAKQARPKAPAALTVTLSYADGEWTVAANQGAKSL